MYATAERRARTDLVEAAMNAQARLAEDERWDEKDDAVLARIHREVHQLERIDTIRDRLRAGLRADLQRIAHVSDTSAPEQLGLLIEARG